MDVKYGSKLVCEQHLVKADTIRSPKITLKPSSTNTLKTLVMWDPDSLTPSWLHWLIINIPSSKQIANGTLRMPYNPPTPPFGTHRYYFGLYEHDVPLSNFGYLNHESFNVNAFVKENKLKLVACCGFVQSAEK